MRRCLLFITTSFFVTACGGGGGSPPPPPTPPSANASTVTLDEDTTGSGTMTGVAGEGGTLSFSVQTQPGNGTLSATGADFEYTPDADFNGTDSFTFTVSEGSLTSAAATITLEVAPVNDAPVAASSNLAATEDVALQDDVTASDVDGDALTLTIVTQPANGAVTPGSGTAFTYQPVADFFGQETFTFTISDGVETTSEETVTIDVAPVNDLPVVTDIADTVTAGTPVTFDLTGTDVENDALNYSLSSNFSKSTVTNDFSTSAMIELTPDYGEWGPDSALYVANDGVGDSAPASIDLEIEVPQTTGTLSFEFYDGNGQADGSSIIEGAADRVYHTGVVRGDFTPGSTVTDEQQYIAIYDAANGVRINEIYLDGPIDERSIATGFVDDRLVTAGSVLGDPTSIHVITLDANDAVDVDVQVIVPYAIVRDFQSFELAHAPGIGFFVIGNDNQLSFIDYDGMRLSTVALPSPPSTEVQAYEVQDVRVIGNTVYIAGFIFECGDDPAMCNSGIGAMGFLITVGTDGAGPQVVGLGTSFTSDSLILDDGTLLQQRRATLARYDASGTTLWERTVNASGSVEVVDGFIDVDASGDVYWYAYDRASKNSYVERLTADNTTIWQTEQATDVIDILWPTGMAVDEYGNMFVSYVDRYNDMNEAFGRIGNMHFDYSGAHQWTEIIVPSDMAPDNGAILTSSYRFVSLANDNINAGGPDADVFLIINTITPPPP